MLGKRKFTWLQKRPNTNYDIVLSNDVLGVLGTAILVKLTTTERKTTLGI